MNPATQAAMTALIRNGGMGGGKMADTYFARNCSLPWANQFDTASGALPLVPVGARGSRRRIGEANTNLIASEPSAGGGTVGNWTAVGTNTVSAVTLASEGLPPLPDGLGGVITTGFKVTYQNSTRMVDLAITLTAAQHSPRAYAFVPASWDGGNVLFQLETFTGGSNGTGISSSGVTGSWVRIGRDTTPLAGDLDGIVTVRANSAPTAGKSMYFAAAQVEQNSYATSYTDGSLGTGYAWTGAAHASTSTRAASRLTASAAVLDETTFAFPLWFTPEFANTDRASGVLRLLDWADDANNFVTVEYDLTTNTFECARKGGTTLATASVAATFSAGDHIFVCPAGDAANVYISVNGAALTAQAQTDIPTLSAATFDIGSDAGAASHCNSIVGPLYAFGRVLTHAEILEMYRAELVPMGAIHA